MKVRNMTEGRPLPLILKVALPLMVGNIFQQLYTVVDARIVGSVEGTAALAALGNSDWFNWLFLGVIQGFAQGFTIPMAQSFGAERYDDLKKYVGHSITLALITSVLLSLIALLSVSPAMDILEVSPIIRPMSTRYISILFAAFPIVMAYNLMAGILRSLGDSRTPLIAMAVASVVNIALDILFVAVFHWGVQGAAAATVIAQACSSIYCFIALASISIVRPSRQDLKINMRTSLKLIGLGAPIAFQNAIIGVGGMVVQRSVNTLQASINKDSVGFVAGYTATNKLYGVLEIAAISFGYATSTFCGQNLGAKKISRIKKGLHVSALLGIVTALVITAFMFIFGKGIVSGFLSGTPEEIDSALKVSLEFLYLMSGCLPVLYILHIYRSALQGMGNTVMPMLSGIAEFIMRTLSVILLPYVIGYQGVFWAEILAWAGADLILVPSYYLFIRRLSINPGYQHSQKEMESDA